MHYFSTSPPFFLFCPVSPRPLLTIPNALADLGTPSLSPLIIGESTEGPKSLGCLGVCLKLSGHGKFHGPTLNRCVDPLLCCTGNRIAILNAIAIHSMIQLLAAALALTAIGVDVSSFSLRVPRWSFLVFLSATKYC